jgi:hypothetical protein
MAIGEAEDVVVHLPRIEWVEDLCLIEADVFLARHALT